MPKVTINKDCSWSSLRFRRGETVVVSHETYDDLFAAGMVAGRHDADGAENPGRRGVPAVLEIAGRHAGETIFLLGCGPSVAECDLSPLDGKITIGVNAILHACDPTYLVFLDTAFAERCGAMLEKSRAVKFCAGRVRTIAPVVRFGRYLPRGGEPILSPDFSRGLYWSRTSIFPAINLAVLFGAKRLVLIGADLNGRGHFYERVVAAAAFPNRDRILGDFHKLAEFARERNIEILNASLQSAISDFPKITLSEIFERTEHDVELLHRRRDAKD